MTPDLPPVLPEHLPSLPEGVEYVGVGDPDNPPAFDCDWVKAGNDDKWFKCTSSHNISGYWDAINPRNHYARTVKPIARANGIGGESSGISGEVESPKPEAVKSRTPIMDAAIAQGWEDKRDLLHCIGTLESDLAAARAERDEYKRAFDVASDALAPEIEEVKRLRAALEFYADVSKYPSPKTGGLGELYFDCGETARKALAPASPNQTTGPNGWRKIQDVTEWVRNARRKFNLPAPRQDEWWEGYNGALNDLERFLDVQPIAPAISGKGEG